MKRFCAYVWRSPVLLFIISLAVVLGIGTLAMKSEIVGEATFSLFRAFVLCLAVIPVLLLLYAMLDCLGSEDDTNKLLWVIIMLFAPILGPLLWFAAGKRSQSSPVDPLTSARGSSS